MFTLKSYQVSALECLSAFLTECTQKSAEQAFIEYAERMQIQKAKYHDVFNGKPCVCLRIPTGGGKTIIGAAAIKKIDDAYCQTGAPVVLWLTPSDAITTQTLKALKDPQHPYRQALDKDFPGAIVTDIDGVTMLTSSDLGLKCVVLVSTIQTFNIEDTNQRRAYGHNEAFEPFFTDIPSELKSGLEEIQEADVNEENGVLNKRNIGQIKFSLANLLALYNPIIIVDEAHNNRTEKFFTTLNRLSPSVVLELTATPIKSVNNVIYQVSAWELKAADMIKLPIVLRGYNSSWETCLLESVNQRNLLESKASEEKDYIRPILLVQAMQKGQSPSPEEVKTYLTETLKIPEEQIAIATGTQKDLQGVDLFDQKTPIRYVITIKALKEGWDCSFAYVLCSLQNIHSSKDVEQLLGRIMRMPYARKRTVLELNRAYADVVSPSTYVAANLLRDNIVEHLGFDQMAATEIFEQVEEKHEEETLTGLFAPVPETQPHTVVSVKDDIGGKLKEVGLDDHVKVTELPDDPNDKKNDGKKVVIAVKVSISTEDMDKLKQVIQEVSTPKSVKPNVQAVQQVSQEIARHTSKQLQQEFPNFNVPRLCYRDGNDVRPVDDKIPSTWNPLSYSKDIVFQPRESITEMVLDVEESSKRMQYEECRETSLTRTLVAVEYTETDLIKSLTAEVKRPDIKPIDLSRFVAEVVRNKLMGERKFDLLTLVRNRVVLKNGFKALLNKNHQEAVKAGYQQQLDLACADIELRYAFPFDPNRYEATRPYDSNKGGRIFKKHYYPVIDDLTYKLPSGRVTEEYWCADAIESNLHVKTWVRNIPRGQYAFHLPLANGHKFFPDFVALLDDGRVFVIEYKGEALKTNDDSKEKMEVGQLWEKHSNGKALFLMATVSDEHGRSVQQQISDKINERR